MLFFGRKKEVSLENFCSGFYDNLFLSPTIKGVDLSDVYPKQIKEQLQDADIVFAHVDVQKIKNELIILNIEIFALAFAHKSDLKVVVDQSIFTKNFLLKRDREDIWNGMDKYNSAIAHASVMNDPHILTKRADLADEVISKMNKLGIHQDESMGRPVNRKYSKNSWEKGITTYFLILAFCQRLGLGFGSDYKGPNKKAQFRQKRPTEKT